MSVQTAGRSQGSEDRLRHSLRGFPGRARDSRKEKKRFVAGGFFPVLEQELLAVADIAGELFVVKK